VYHRHPWILQITTGRPPLEPGQLAWLDCGLRTLSATRLDPKKKMSVILLVLNYVRGEAQISTGLLQTHKRTRRENRQMQAWYGRMLARLLDAERFPALAKVSAAGVFDPDDGGSGADFDFGLARILDGVEVLLHARLDSTEAVNKRRAGPSGPTPVSRARQRRVRRPASRPAE
jgi:hypothetical protein